MSAEQIFVPLLRGNASAERTTVLPALAARAGFPTIAATVTTSSSSASAGTAPPPVLVSLLQTFGDYCQALFRQLALDAPGELSHLVRVARLPVHHLTFAAEALGSVDADLAVTPLLLLLGHPSPIVREGAVYGLQRHLASPGVGQRLTELAREDPSPAVRTAATDALSDD